MATRNGGANGDKNAKKPKKGAASAVVPITASLANTVYTIDPRRSLVSVRSDGAHSDTTHSDALVRRFKAVCEAVPSSSSWRAITPSDGGAVAPETFTRAMRGADVVVQMGPNTLLTETSASVLRTLPLDGVKAVLCFDRCAGDGGAARTDPPPPPHHDANTTRDVGTGIHYSSHTDKAHRGVFESPPSQVKSSQTSHALAAVLTLRGALMIGLNQWSSRGEDTEGLARAVLTTSGSAWPFPPVLAP